MLFLFQTLANLVKEAIKAQMQNLNDIFQNEIQTTYDILQLKLQKKGLLLNPPPVYPPPPLPAKKMSKTQKLRGKEHKGKEQKGKEQKGKEQKGKEQKKKKKKK